MSRGFGRKQRASLDVIRRHGKPMTFEEIRAAIRHAAGLDAGDRLPPSFERSLRRALHGLVAGGALVAIGGGGRADPFRYFMAPVLIAIASETPEQGHAWLDALAADPGADALSNHRGLG